MGLRLFGAIGASAAYAFVLLEARTIEGDVTKMEDIPEEASSYPTFIPDDPEGGFSSYPTIPFSTTINPNATSNWGPKRDSLFVVIPITVLYALIFLSGIIGNFSTCVVIARNRSMHTATNYYLFSLAVSDLLLLLSGLPPEMYYIWSNYPYVFGESVCIAQGFAAETSANATVLTITAFTVERYVAICHPFLSHAFSRLSRAVKLIIIVWLVALGLALPQALEFGVVYEKSADGHVLGEEYRVCTVKRVLIPHAFEISTCLFFLTPMTLITVLYVLIGVQLHRSTMMARNGGAQIRNAAVPIEEGAGDGIVSAADACKSCNRDSRKNFAKNAQTKATKHVVKMLAAVVVAFFICWAPFHAQRLLAIYGEGGERPTPDVITAYRALTYVSGILYYFSTTVNPVLYHIMSHKFREAFKDTLGCCIGRQRQRGGRFYSVLSKSSRAANGDTSSSGCREDSFAAGVVHATPNSLRFLEADVARQERRPLVVSFRPKRPLASTCPPTGDAQVCVSVVGKGVGKRRRWPRGDSRSSVPIVSSVVYRAPRVPATFEPPIKEQTAEKSVDIPIDAEACEDTVVSVELTLYMDEIKRQQNTQP